MTELTPEQEKELHNLSEALRQEFALKEASTHSAQALNDLEDLKPTFLATLKNLAEHAPKDELRAKIAMWGYDKLLDQGKANNDPIRDLIEGMGLPADKRTKPAPTEPQLIESGNEPFEDADGAE